MKRSPAAAISDAVLYEGYLLYPYRDSAIKNQYRWTFGCLFPPDWCRHQDPSDRDHLHAEFLMTTTPQAELNIQLRCLILPPAEQSDGDAQPVERQVVLAGTGPDQCIDKPFGESFWLSAESDGPCEGELARSAAVQGHLQIEWTKVQGDVWRVAIEVRNVTESNRSDTETRDETRDGAARQALLSTQLSLRCRHAEFISLIDPPADLRSEASECRNDGCWPVLSGLPGTHDQLLIAPIILYDYPQVAPESQGEMFDGTEIDEILTMRIRTLTDQEKAEMADSDPRAHELLQRSESLPDDELSQMHGVMRPSSTHGQSLKKESVLEGLAPESLRVDGVELRPGDQVVLHPKGRNDIFDLALCGRTATIETIERDFEDQLYFTVTANCDPGRDFGQMGLPGHRFYFRPNEVKPVVQGSPVKP